MAVNGNGGSSTNYEPNSDKQSPLQHPSGQLSSYQVTGMVGRSKPQHSNDDFEQPRQFWLNVLDDNERNHLVNNLAGSIGSARKDIQQRQLDVFAKVHPDLAKRISEAIAKKYPQQKANL